jgi:hypothetical protein
MRQIALLGGRWRGVAAHVRSQRDLVAARLLATRRAVLFLLGAPLDQLLHRRDAALVVGQRAARLRQARLRQLHRGVLLRDRLLSRCMKPW